MRGGKCFQLKLFCLQVMIEGTKFDDLIWFLLEGILMTNLFNAAEHRFFDYLKFRVFVECLSIFKCLLFIMIYWLKNCRQVRFGKFFILEITPRLKNENSNTIKSKLSQRNELFIKKVLLFHMGNFIKAYVIIVSTVLVFCSHCVSAIALYFKPIDSRLSLLSLWSTY